MYKYTCIHIENAFITPTSDNKDHKASIFRSTSLLYQLAYQKALPHHIKLTYQKEQFLKKNEKTTKHKQKSHQTSKTLSIQIAFLTLL